MNQKEFFIIKNKTIFEVSSFLRELGETLKDKKKELVCTYVVGHACFYRDFISLQYLSPNDTKSKVYYWEKLILDQVKNNLRPELFDYTLFINAYRAGDDIILEIESHHLELMELIHLNDLILPFKFKQEEGNIFSLEIQKNLLRWQEIKENAVPIHFNLVYPLTVEDLKEYRTDYDEFIPSLGNRMIALEEEMLWNYFQSNYIQTRTSLDDFLTWKESVEAEEHISKIKHTLGILLPVKIEIEDIL